MSVIGSAAACLRMAPGWGRCPAPWNATAKPDSRRGPRHWARPFSRTLLRRPARSNRRRTTMRDNTMKPSMGGSPSSAAYAAARQEWLERYGDYIAQARHWRLIAILALLVAAGALVGLVLL